MNTTQKEKAYLILADGTVFQGESIGLSGEAIGEAVFSTAMSGYLETLTDPSNFGQIVIQTFPMIGNYGAIINDREGDKVWVAGYVIRELCETGSNFRKDLELSDYLKQNGVVGICGIDTRLLTRIIRDKGVMGAMISDNKKDIEAKIKKIKAYKVSCSLKNTSTKEVVYSGNEKGKRIVLWDFGVKAGIVDKLVKRGCYVIRIPYNTTADEIIKLKPDGILLSNGGGNPGDEPDIIKQITAVSERKIPMFGICLGHQLLAIANGAKTNRLKCGHRGFNQPIKDVDTGRVYITSQNHGYAVVPSSLPSDKARINLINANDKTCEGIEYLDKPAFSVQFHPEGCGGPRDTEFFFDKFIEMTGGK